MKKSGKRSVLFVFLLVLIFVSMAVFVSADVLINEFLVAPNSDWDNNGSYHSSGDEWIELYNNGSDGVNISGWKILDDISIRHTFPTSTIINAYSFWVVYGSNTTSGLNLNNAGDTINLTNSSGFLMDNYTYTSNPGSDVSIGRYPDGSLTWSTSNAPTPGAKNDKDAPVLNKWLKPSKNNSIIGGLFNITVNITDVTNVSSVLVDYNNINYLMSQNNDLWYYLWDTTKNSDGSYNITIFFNDTLGFSNTNTLFNITANNNPKIYNPTTTANSRNFISKNSVFNASVNATDSNLLNVTCTLNSVTVGNFSKEGDIHKCSLTAPSTENDFVIAFTAIDKAGNTNTTTTSFTTKYSTAASLIMQDITVNGLNQSDKIVEVTATFNNKGSSTIYSPNIILDGFVGNFAEATADRNKTCAANLTAGQSCSTAFNITIFGGKAAGSYSILWNANWTDNSFTANELIEAATSPVTINSNPQITATKNRTATIEHNANQTLNILLNSTGNSNLQNVNIVFTPSTLQQSWVTISPSSFSSITAGTNESFNVTVAIPKYTSPGNYTGTLTISATSAQSKSILLIIEVPEDSSWASYPSSITTYKKTNSAGLLGTIYINNSGNIGHRFDFAAAGSLRTYIWNSSNPASQYVEKGTIEVVNFYYKTAIGFLDSYTATLTITSSNKSTANYTYFSLTRDDNNPTLNITSPLNNTFVKGDVNFKVNATDLNLIKIEFYINNNLVFNDANLTKTFNWSTTSGSYQDEVYTLKAIAYDSAGNSNSSSISVAVNNTDDKPVLKANISAINIVEDNDSTILNLSLYFKTIDGDSLKYSFIQPNNVTVHVNNATQIANFSPAANFAGLNYIIFTAVDTSNQTTSSNNVTINVTNVNDIPTAPTLLSPANNSAVFSATGKVTLNWTASTDADNDVLAYYAFYGTDTNVASSANTPNTYLTLTSLANATTYYWKVYASDGTANSANSSMLQFTVTRDDSPIIINYTPSNLTPSVAENSTLKLNVTASDPDGGLLNYTWYVDSILNKRDGNEFNYTPNFAAAGIHTIKVNITDNNSNVASNIPMWTVTVTNTNREPILDAILDITTATEDSVLEFNITASDPDGDALNFTSNISSILFTNAANNSMATVSWTPTNDYVGNNLVAFTVNDSSKIDSKTITITVTNTNDAPIITSFSPKENKTIAEGVGSQRFEVVFADVDVGDYANATWFGNTTINTPIIANSSNVTVTGLAKGIYDIIVIVNDTSGAQARHEWKLTVTTDIFGDGLTSPVLNLNESQRQNAANVTINQSTFGGIDFGNNTLNFSGVAVLNDAFNISQGIISVDTNRFPGLNKPAYLVMKGINYTKAPWIYNASEFESTAGGGICPEDVCTNITYDAASGILRFNVPHFSTYYTQTNTTNGAPIITSTPATKATERAKYTYDVDAVDPDGNTLTFSLIISPSGMSINSNTGLISWTPVYTQLGSHNVTVNVSDSNLTTFQSFEINVSKGPRLVISDLDVKVDSKTDKNVQNNTKISEEAKPGSNVEFKLEIENLFTKEEDLKIEDISTEITIEGIDDGDDIDQDAKEFDLKPGKDEKITIEFEIPLEVDEDTYNVLIEAEGEDENGTVHNTLYELRLEVDKEKHEIKIIKSALTPSTITCQRKISINTEIINTGAEDEEDVALEVTSAELGISSLTRGIKLDEGTDDNRFAKVITESISADAAPGAYSITINAYYGSTLSESKTVELTVEECELVKEIKKEVKEEKPKVEVITPPVVIEKKPVAEVSFAQTSGYTTALTILIVLFLGTAVFIVGAAYIVLRK